MLNLRVLTSLHRVFPADCPTTDFGEFTCARNEQLSFQVAFRLDAGDRHTLPVFFRAESELPVKAYLVGNVPVLHTYSDGLEPQQAPGPVPDMLLEKAINPALTVSESPWVRLRTEKAENTLINASADSWQSVWFCVNEERAKLTPGQYTLRITFESVVEGICSESVDVNIDVKPFALPRQTFMYTNWLHVDCLADYYNIEPYTPRFFEILGDYAHKAAVNGMNTVLLPAFTPPLDTPIGQYRRDVQLVRVIREGGSYRFDFTVMKRFIDVCRKAGIEYFEHSHFFSQWGAKTAPMVMAEANGKRRRIFGWDKPADCPSYKKFLQAYIPAVRAFLRDERLEHKVIFHISDEPTEANLDTYTRAADTVRGLLDGCMCGDALSDYSLYEKGVVRIPIVAMQSIDSFRGRCPHFWGYYTGGNVSGGQSNRLLSIAPERNRIMGVQQYAYGTEGFLHWGYNYWYDMLSRGLFEPATNPCGYNNNPGTSFCVYPGRDGRAIQSSRQKVFGEAINDIRALQYLEKLSDRGTCEKLLRKYFGEVDTHTLPASPEALLRFRNEVNAAIVRYKK